MFFCFFFSKEQRFLEPQLAPGAGLRPAAVPASAPAGPADHWAVGKPKMSRPGRGAKKGKAMGKPEGSKRNIGGSQEQHGE